MKQKLENSAHSFERKRLLVQEVSNSGVEEMILATKKKKN